MTVIYIISLVISFGDIQMYLGFVSNCEFRISTFPFSSFIIHHSSFIIHQLVE
ncbi:MAG: hypothetical protein NT166_12765 [Candidatus Aminicenantes bacterium]|nr:hypothetical protein [Candidatus Aminicenantes bacterium]